MKCPRCQVAMNEVEVRECTVDLCPQCDGSWYDADELIRVLEAPYSTVAASPLSTALVEDVEAAASSANALPCPRCRKGMNRYRYLDRCPVLADGCPDHGVWLDDGELSKLFEFVRTCEQAQGEQSEQVRAELEKHRDEARGSLRQLASLEAPALARYPGLVLDAISRLFHKPGP